MKGKAINMREGVNNLYKEHEKKLEDLEKKSKSLSELIFSEKFMVEEVLCKSSSTSFTPSSERRYGGESPVYDGGYNLELRLKVQAENRNLPTHLIDFYGHSIVKAGDTIIAKIPKYKKQEENIDPFSISKRNNTKIFYFDRDYGLEEEAIELSILSNEGKVLRLDRSVSYEIYFPE